MNALAALSIGVSALGWCLLHFVWQAAVIGAVYALVRAALPRGNPRYVAAMLALTAMAVCPIATGVHEFSLTADPVELAVMQVAPTSSVAASAATTATPAWQLLLNASLPWLVLVWALGAGALGARVYRQWHGLRRMLAAAEQLPEWQARARQFAQRLGLRRAVPVLASVRVATPTLIGWIKPAVVLPLAVLAQMPPAQIDLVLAHELAHLKRFDHIANLFQVVLETLFFYHPAVHWISREARNERELCCDMLALRVTGGERRDFVAALANLEEFRAGHAGLALAASGGVLAERAWFIAGAVPKRPQRHLRSHAIVMVVVLALAGAGWAWWRDTTWQQRTAVLLAANNASVLHLAMQELRASAWSPSVRISSKPVLPPIAYPVLRVSDNEASSTAASVPTVSLPIDQPKLALTNIPLHLLPIATVAAPSLDTTVRLPATAPRPLHTVPPKYPPEALLSGIQGRVVVEFTLDAAGVPHDLEVVDTSSGQFNTAALRAMSDWRFAPPAVPGRRYRQAFTFRLGDDAGADAATAQPCTVTTGTHICRHL
jgi:TonB family protein